MLFSRLLLCSHLPFVRSLLWVVTLSASYYRRRGRKVLEWFPIYVFLQHSLFLLTIRRPKGLEACECELKLVQRVEGEFRMLSVYV